MPLDVPFLSFEEAEGYYTCAASSAKDTLKEQKKTRTTFLHLDSTKHQNNAFATCWMLSSRSLWSWKKEAFSTSSGWVWHIVKLIKQWKAGGQSSIAPLELSLIFQVGRVMKIVSWVQNVSSSKQFGTGKGRGRAGGLVLSNYYSYSCTALTLRSFWQCHYFIMTEHWRQTNKIQLISAEKCFRILWIRYPNKVHFQSKPQELQNHS